MNVQKISPLRSPEGYKTVAGGRSEAQTTGWQLEMIAPRRESMLEEISWSFSHHFVV